jgi:CPA1 family monovalent cation:H+ antiporter
MIEAAIFIFLMTAATLLIQEKLRVPAPMSLVGFMLICKAFGLHIVNMDDKTFDQVILLMLPVLIMVDAMALKLEDLKAHAFSLFYLAVLAVILSIVMCVALNQFILPDYNLSVPAIIALFCMVMATDPVAVSAVFSNFKVPHNLKIMAEGESLFNDATALIMFTMAISFMSGSAPTDVTPLIGHGIMVIVGAVIIGVVTGMIGLYLMSLTRQESYETCILLCVAYIPYVVAEHFHYSGILSTIIAVLTANHIIQKRISLDDEIISEGLETGKRRRSNGLKRFKDAVVDRGNHESIINNIKIIALFGLTILFVSLADLVSLEKLETYWKEILSVFIATTLIRMMVMLKFAALAGRIPKSHSVSFHWWSILSSAGVKGGLSILMLHMLPRDFEHKDLYEAIVVGVVLLSTFIYPVIMMVLMKVFEKKFEAEVAEEALAH